MVPVVVEVAVVLGGEGEIDLAPERDPAPEKHDGVGGGGRGGGEGQGHDEAEANPAAHGPHSISRDPRGLMLCSRPEAASPG